jgi:ribonuclease J
VAAFPVDHSVPGSSAFAVQTSEGWVVYTGDLRLHGAEAKATAEFFERAASLRPLVLICEGTHPETKQPVTEEEVYYHALGGVMSTAGLVVADFGPRNVERLLTFRAIAEATGRQLALTAKDAYLLEAMSLADSAIPNPMRDEGFVMYVEAKASRPVWEEVLIERWPDDRLRSARQIGARPGGFILCFSFYDLGELIDIAPESGVYIYSASEAFHEEAWVDLERVRNWAGYWNLRFVGDPGNQKGKGREPGFHASGHIHGPGLAAMIKELSPKFLVPVHTENPTFFRKSAKAGMTVIVPEPGQPVVISGKSARAG